MKLNILLFLQAQQVSVILYSHLNLIYLCAALVSYLFLIELGYVSYRKHKLSSNLKTSLIRLQINMRCSQISFQVLQESELSFHTTHNSKALCCEKSFLLFS